jgi:hypothetical protein
MADDKLDFKQIHTPVDHKGTVKVTRITHRSGFKMLAYECTLEEDFDGAPQCYGSRNTSPVDAKANPATGRQADIKERVRGSTARDDRTTLDFLSNAASSPANFLAGNKDFAWAGLYAAPQAFATRNGFSIDRRDFLEARRRPREDKDDGVFPKDQKTIPLGKDEPGWFPAIQGDGAPAPGFYVSGSPVYADRSLRDWNQRKYVNAQAIPFAALTPWYKRWAVALGDFGLAIDPETGAASGFVFGDAGYDDKVGEVSTNLLTALGGDNERSTLFLVFPGSGARVGDAFKFNMEISVQLGAALAVREISQLPDTDSLLSFLAFDADLDRYNLFRARKLADAATIEADGRLPIIEAALKEYWFDP